MWNWIMDNYVIVSFLVFFIFAAILPFTGIVEFGKRLREKEDNQHQ
jgi:hypothetical protein